jgi:hypothetical protein
VTWLQAILEFVKAVFGLITGLAWPVVIGLIVWWFRKGIARLIDRIFELKGFGVELRAKESVERALGNVKVNAADATTKAIEDARKTLRQKDPESTEFATAAADTLFRPTGNDLFCPRQIRWQFLPARVYSDRPFAGTAEGILPAVQSQDNNGAVQGGPLFSAISTGCGSLNDFRFVS